MSARARRTRRKQKPESAEVISAKTRDWSTKARTRICLGLLLFLGVLLVVSLPWGPWPAVAILMLMGGVGKKLAASTE